MREAWAHTKGTYRAMWLRGRGQERMPDFFIGGFPKCATTTLAAYLATHPDVFVALQKEIHFYDRQYARGLAWYRRQFAGAAGTRAAGEATPSYLLWDEVMERIAETAPAARLIAVLRNPVERAYSHYWWRRVNERAERRSFEQAVRDEMQRDPEEPVRLDAGYLRIGQYARHLERALRFFPREHLHVTLAEDLRRDPLGTFGAVCRFLAVADDFAPPNLGARANVAFEYRSARLRIAMMRTRAFRWLPFALLIEQMNQSPVRYPPIDPAMRVELVDWFAADNARLSEMLGRDLVALWSS